MKPDQKGSPVTKRRGEIHRLRSLPMFSPDARFISAPTRETRDHDVIWVFESATGKARLAARLPFHVTFRANWVDNGTAFLVNKDEPESHVVLFDRFWTRAGGTGR